MLHLVVSLLGQLPAACQLLAQVFICKYRYIDFALYVLCIVYVACVHNHLVIYKCA